VDSSSSTRSTGADDMRFLSEVERLAKKYLTPAEVDAGITEVEKVAFHRQLKGWPAVAVAEVEGEIDNVLADVEGPSGTTGPTGGTGGTGGTGSTGPTGGTGSSSTEV
jgi:hypothetical protein